MLSTVNARGVPGDPSHSLQSLASEPGSVIRIGRHLESNIILEHPDFPYLISRRHAEISIVDGTVSIVDTGSKNGVFLNGTRLQTGAVTELKDGSELCFGCTHTIAKDGRPERNPFVFSVHGLVALLCLAHAATQDRAGQDTQEARPADGQPLAKPRSEARPVFAAPAPEQQEQEQQASAEPACPQGLPPESGVPVEAAVGAPQEQEQQQHSQPLQQQAAEQHAMLAPPIAAPEDPMDLTGSPDVARGAWAAAPAAATPQRANEIVDLTMGDDDDGDDDDVAVIAELEAARLSTPAAGGSAQSDRKRKRPQFLAEGAARSSRMREGAGEDGIEEPAAGLAGPSMLRKLEDDFECVICRDLLVGAHTLVPCGHVFCGQCLHGWLQKNATCPNCRTKVTAAPVPALLINNTAEGLEGGLSPEDAAERERRKEQWKEVAATAMAGWQAMFAAGGRGRAPKPRIQHIRGTGVYHGSHVQSGLDDGDLQAQLWAAAEARVDLPRMPRDFYPRRSTRNPDGRSAEREIASAEAHMAEQRQRVQQLMADMARRSAEFPEGPRYYGYIGRRPPTPPARHGEVPGMPGQAVQQDSEYSVGYHAGSRATCMGCPRPIAPPEVRMQRRSRMPPGGVMIQQYWHPQCFPGWATLPHPLPGVEQLRPHDQGAVQARMILH